MGGPQNWGGGVLSKQDAQIANITTHSEGMFLVYYTSHNMLSAKAKSQQFTRRKSGLVKKADELARLCHADLALIIRKNNRYYIYRSTDHDQWPPTITEIVCMDLIDISTLR